MNEKILFLDFDGVLNSIEYTVKVSERDGHWISNDLDRKAVNLLKNIVEKTKCKIVVSSTWRLGGIGKDSAVCESLSARNGDVICDAIIDRTTCNYDNSNPETWRRGYQIQKWIDDNDFSGKFVILDDEISDMDHLKDFVVKTNIQFGLTTKEHDEIIKRFNDK